ncbi:MAG: hypothetical protein WC758_08345 [Candidatus Woesearchaeota archaeon]|jgi:hypothetical protein
MSAKKFKFMTRKEMYAQEESKLITESSLNLKNIYEFKDSDFVKVFDKMYDIIYLKNSENNLGRVNKSAKEDVLRTNYLITIIKIEEDLASCYGRMSKGERNNFDVKREVIDFTIDNVCDQLFEYVSIQKK